MPRTKILVSSANNLIEALGTEFETSFTNNRNNKGPKTDPYGTPQDIFPKSEVTLANVTNCCLLVK